MVQNHTDYQSKSDRLLSDTSTYKKLSTDPLPNFLLEAHELVLRAAGEGIVTKLEVAFLKLDFYKRPYFYHLPKVHKDPKNPTGRQIVAAMESVTSYFLIYLDHFLQPIVRNLPSYIKDCIYLSDMLQHYSWEPTYRWLSLDVVSLYNSIPHKKVLIDSCSWTCDCHHPI